MKALFFRSVLPRAAVCSLLGAAAGAASLLLTARSKRQLRRRLKRGLRELGAALETAQRLLGSF